MFITLGRLNRVRGHKSGVWEGGAHFGVYEAEERETDFFWSVKAEGREPIYILGFRAEGRETQFLGS